MEDDKRKIIVREIETWRRNRLLPEHYCDFLANLYRDNEEETKQVLGLPISRIRKGKPTTWFLLFGTVGAIFYMIAYFTSFPLPMQIAVLALAVLLFFFLGVRQRQKRPMLSMFFLGVGALAGPGGGLYLLIVNGAATWAALVWAVCSAIFWMVTGLTSRFPVFHFAGWVVMGLVYGWVLNDNIPDPGWGGLQMGWMPACILLVWFGWLLQHRNKQTGVVLLAAGALLWFAPEIHGLSATELSPWLLQLSLGAKLLAGTMMLFASRNKWIEWVV